MKRPVFKISLDEKLFTAENVEFEWCCGRSVMHRKTSMNNLHQVYLELHPGAEILEVSTKSENPLGINLSAFNLMIHDEGKSYPVECAYQGSKVCKHGGPYVELLEKTPREAKQYKILKASGNVIGFSYKGENFSLKPPTFFFDWIYINAIAQNPALADELINYEVFTDIEFNPRKSSNTQARSAAIYVSLRRQNLLSEALSDKEKFAKILYVSDNS